MSHAIDAESSLMDEKHATEAGVHKSAPEVAPAIGCQGNREDKAKEESNWQVVTMLEHNSAMGIEIADIDTACSTRILFEDHPTDMGIPETFVD